MSTSAGRSTGSRISPLPAGNGSSSEPPMNRRTYIGVTYVERLRKYRSCFYSPLENKTVGTGTWSSPYEAARARHERVATLPASMRMRVSDDFEYDERDARERVKPVELTGEEREAIAARAKGRTVHKRALPTLSSSTSAKTTTKSRQPHSVGAASEGTARHKPVIESSSHPSKGGGPFPVRGGRPGPSSATGVAGAARHGMVGRGGMIIYRGASSDPQMWRPLSLDVPMPLAQAPSSPPPSSVAEAAGTLSLISSCKASSGPGQEHAAQDEEETVRHVSSPPFYVNKKARVDVSSPFDDVPTPYHAPIRVEGRGRGRLLSLALPPVGRVTGPLLPVGAGATPYPPWAVPVGGGSHHVTSSRGKGAGAALKLPATTSSLPTQEKASSLLPASPLGLALEGIHGQWDDRYGHGYGPASSTAAVSLSLPSLPTSTLLPSCTSGMSLPMSMGMGADVLPSGGAVPGAGAGMGDAWSPIGMGTQFPHPVPMGMGSPLSLSLPMHAVQGVSTPIGMQGGVNRMFNFE